MKSIYSSRSNIIIGCTAAVISSACQSIGLILQRKSYINSNLNSNLNSQSYNRSLWHLGLFLFLFANIFGSSIQITSLPLIVLSPLQSIGLVFNTLFHSILLNEPFTNSSFYGTILIAFGAFFTAYCGGSLVEPDYTLIQFIEFLKNKNFIILICIDLFIILLISTLINLIIKQINSNLISIHLNNLNLKYNNNNDNNINYFPKLVLNNYINFLNFIFNHNPVTLWKVNGLLFGIISGILSGFSILLAKSSIEILITCFINHNWKSLNYSISYFIVLIFLLLGLSQLYLLNKGLKNISTSVLYPLVFFIYNLVSISNSLVFFKQWNQLTYFTLSILIIGSSFIMIGVFLLSLQDIEMDNKNNNNDIRINPDNYNDNSPISNLNSKYYNSINSNLHSNNYKDTSISDNEISEIDIENLSNSSTSLDSNLSNNNNNNNSSIGTVNYNLIDNSTNQNNPNNNTVVSSNNDILAPFMRRADNLITNTNRKVSGFLTLKSNNTINHENSDLSLDKTYKNTDLINQNHNIHEYVSFDSLRDMTSPTSNNNSNNFDSMKSISNTLSNEYKTLLHDNNNFNSKNKTKKYSDPNTSVESTNTISISHGLNILNPFLGKIKKLDIPNSNNNNNTSINENTSFSKIPSSYKSIARSIKNLANFDSLNSSNNDIEKQPKLKNKKSQKFNADDDYNPNNNFNYSFNNTLEEIQNQMSEYESPIEYHIPSPKVNNNQFNNNNNNNNILGDLFEGSSNSNIDNNKIDDSNESNESIESPTITARKLPRAFSAKFRNTDNGHFQHKRNRSKELRRATINDLRINCNVGNNNNTNNNNNYNKNHINNLRKEYNHKRVLSFEQTELLNDLKK